MTQRHSIQNDVIMFITTNMYDREPVFENDAYAREAIETLYRVQNMRPFILYGFVVMPDHCHLLLRVLSPETISKIMQVFKSAVPLNIGTQSIWQRRFNMQIPDDPKAVLHYIHMNPVKAGLVNTPEAYPWSSACGKWEITPLPLPIKHHA